MRRRVPEHGALRIRHGFLWFRKSLELKRWGGIREMRWLESAEWFEEYDATPFGGWVARWWWSDKLEQSFRTGRKT